MTKALDLPADVLDEVRAARARIRIGFPRWLRPFVFRDVIGLTLGRTVYLLPEFVGRGEDDVVRLVRHELAHVRQVNRLTLPVFLLCYAFEFVYHLVRERSAARAYGLISFETEARAAEGGRIDR